MLKCMENIDTNSHIAALRTATVLVAKGETQTQSY